MTGMGTHEITAPEFRLPKRNHNESCKFVLSWEISADVASLIMKFEFSMFGSGQLTPLRGRSNKSQDQVRGIHGSSIFLAQQGPAPVAGPEIGLWGPRKSKGWKVSNFSRLRRPTELGEPRNVEQTPC